MQYVVKGNGKLLDINNRQVEHFNDANVIPNRDLARFYKRIAKKSGFEKVSVYRVKVKPVEFQKVR